MINVSRLNKADAKRIKKQLWSLIEGNLEKGMTKKPPEEDEACSFLYKLRQEQTFQSYLRWYDLHVGADYRKLNGFSFRAISFCEWVRRNHPERYEDAREKVAGTTKVVRSREGERVLRGIVGDHIRGEDAVENGVKVIYRAIHRKAYPSKKTKQKKYNCATHVGVPCPKNCSYLKAFMRDFNRRNMQFKPLNTTDPAILSQVIGEDSPEDTFD